MALLEGTRNGSDSVIPADAWANMDRGPDQKVEGNSERFPVRHQECGRLHTCSRSGSCMCTPVSGF